MRASKSRYHKRLSLHSASKEVHNNWEISYGDMITLLLGFFILFFNIKQDRVNMKLFVEKLEKKFNNATGESTQTGIQQKQITKNHLLSSPSLQKYKLHTNMYGEKLHIEFPGVSFFTPGKTVLTDEGKKALELFAQSIDKHIGSVRFVIRGYTDNNMVQKEPTKNLELSAWRSLSAIKYLNKKGLDLKYLRIAGYGESDLSNRSLPESQRRFDRKIVIVVEPLDSSERNHDFLNKIAEKETQKEENLKKINDKKVKKEADMHYQSMIDFIESRSYVTWLNDHTDIKIQPPQPKAKIATKPLKIVPRPIDPVSPQEPFRKPAFFDPNIPDQKQVDAQVIDWAEKTYLYKKINPFYQNKPLGKSRGQQ